MSPGDNTPARTARVPMKDRLRWSISGFQGVAQSFTVQGLREGSSRAACAMVKVEGVARVEFPAVCTRKAGGDFLRHLGIRQRRRCAGDMGAKRGTLLGSHAGAGFGYQLGIRCTLVVSDLREAVEVEHEARMQLRYRAVLVERSALGNEGASDIVEALWGEHCQ